MMDAIASAQSAAELVWLRAEARGDSEATRAARGSTSSSTR